MRRQPRFSLAEGEMAIASAGGKRGWLRGAGKAWFREEATAATVRNCMGNHQ
jgi:hypothetical protein